jgi:hypothetical protein
MAATGRVGAGIAGLTGGAAAGLPMGVSGTRPIGSARRGGPPLACGGGGLSGASGSSRASTTGVGEGVDGGIAARRTPGTEGAAPSSSGAPQYLQKRVPATQCPRQREQVTIFAGIAPEEAMSTTGAPTICSPSKLLGGGSNRGAGEGSGRGAGGGSRRGSRAVGGGSRGLAAASGSAARRSGAPQVTQKRYSGGFEVWHSLQICAGLARGGAGGAGGGGGGNGGGRGGSATLSVAGPNENAGAAGRARRPAEGGPDGELPRLESGPLSAATLPAGSARGSSTLGIPLGGVGATPRCWRKRRPQS